MAHNVRGWVSMVVVASVWLIPVTSQAQWVVIDPSVLEQTILQVEKAMQTIHNQVKQIDLMLKNVKALPDYVLGGILQDVQQMQDVLQRIQGMQFSLREIQQQYSALYAIKHVPQTSEDMAVRYNLMMRQMYHSILDAMQAQSLISGQPYDAARLAQAMSASQTAVGNLQAQQANGELLGMVVQQLLRTQQITATHSRTVVSFLAQINAAEAAAIRSKKVFYGVPVTD